MRPPGRPSGFRRPPCASAQCATSRGHFRARHGDIDSAQRARPPVTSGRRDGRFFPPPNARPPVTARRTMASSAGRSWSGNRIVPTRRTMASALRFRPARGLPDAGRKKRLSGADSLNALAVSLVFDTLEFLLQLKVAAQEADRSDGEDQQQKTGVHIHNDLLSGITCCGRGRDCRRRGRRWRRGRERTG